VDALSRTVETLQRQLRDLSARLTYLEAARAAEQHEKTDYPLFHEGHTVVGKIPLFGSGYAVLVLKTATGTFQLEMV
jgi:hypothetical protein